MILRKDSYASITAQQSLSLGTIGTQKKKNGKKLLKWFAMNDECDRSRMIEFVDSSHMYFLMVTQQCFCARRNNETNDVELPKNVTNERICQCKHTKKSSFLVAADHYLLALLAIIDRRCFFSLLISFRQRPWVAFHAVIPLTLNANGEKVQTLKRHTAPIRVLSASISFRNESKANNQKRET